MHTVQITSQYVSAKTGQLVDALSPEGWAQLLRRIEEMKAHAAVLRVAPYADDHGRGIEVTVGEQRGEMGAYALHDLARRHGALAVCL
jgi:hypothetical protein